MEKKLTEEWKDIEGYEGQYQVSNLGNVRSLDRFVNFYNKKKSGFSIRFFKGEILKQYKRGEYLAVNLNTNGVGKFVSVHRLVAIAFVPNPNGYPIVNHKDENKLNNCVENLEWCTQGYNNSYGSRINKSINTRRKKDNLKQSDESKKKISDSLKNYFRDNPISEDVKDRMSKAHNKPVAQYSLDGIFIRQWSSAKMAEEECGFSRNSICECCRGKKKTHKGFIWKYT